MDGPICDAHSMSADISRLGGDWIEEAAKPPKNGCPIWMPLTGSVGVGARVGVVNEQDAD